MNNYEKIETYLKHNLHVSVKDTDGEFSIISPMKDSNGNYRISGWGATLERAKQHIGKADGFSRLEDASKDWTEITPFHLDFEPYPVGIKVQVIQTGEVREIKSTRLKDMYILKDDGATCYSHTELIPYFEEALIEMTIEQIEEKLNITGLKIVK